MRLVFSEIKYTKWKMASARKSLSCKARRKLKSIAYKARLKRERGDYNRHVGSIIAPKDCRLLINNSECLAFFNELRSERNINVYRGILKYIIIDFELIENVDYSFVSITKAILHQFAFSKVEVRGNFPKNEKVKQFLTNAGYFEDFYDRNGAKFTLKSESDRVKFTLGGGVFDEQPIIDRTLQKIKLHLTGKQERFKEMMTVISEICGNSIEHSGSKNNQWVMGVMYGKGVVEVTLTDIGAGILRTLNRKLAQLFKDALTRDSVDVLRGAFDKNYFSRTNDVNRNKGLPVIKNRFTSGKLKELIVLTNDVLLNFNNHEESKKFDRNNIYFRGTFYRWIIDSTCFD